MRRPPQAVPRELNEGPEGGLGVCWLLLLVNMEIYGRQRRQQAAAQAARARAPERQRAHKPQSLCQSREPQRISPQCLPVPVRQCPVPVYPCPGVWHQPCTTYNQPLAPAPSPSPSPQRP